MSGRARIPLHGYNHRPGGSDPIPGIAAPSTPNYAAAVASTFGTDLVGYWKMDAASGDQPDYSPSPPYGDKPLIASGSGGTYKVTGALPPEQDDGAFQAGHGFSAVDSGGRWGFLNNLPYSVGFFVNPATVGATGSSWFPLVGTQTFGASPPIDKWGASLLRSGSTASINFARSNGVTDTQLVASLLTLSVWTHVLCTYDGATMFVYYDGALDTSVASAHTQSTGTTINVLRGTFFGGSPFPFTGAIDEIFVAKRATLPGEVLGLYQASQGTLADMVPAADGLGGSDWEYPTVQVTY